MLKDVCELSSLLQNHDVKKSYLEKKILSLNSAIEQQNHRLQYEIDEYQRVLGSQLALRDQVQDFSIAIDLTSAAIEETKKEEWNTKFENIKTQVQQLIIEREKILQQLREIEHATADLKVTIISDAPAAKQLKIDITSISSEITSKSNELMILENALLDRKSRLDILTASQSDINSQINRVNQQIESTKSDISQINESIVSLTKQEQVMDQSIVTTHSNHQEAVKQHQNDTKVKNDASTTTTNEILPVLQSEHLQLTSRLETLQFEFTALQNLATTHASKKEMLTAHIKVLNKFLVETQSAVCTQKLINESIKSAIHDETIKIAAISDFSSVQMFTQGIAKSIENCLDSLSKIQQESDALRYLISMFTATNTDTPLSIPPNASPTQVNQISTLLLQINKHTERKKELLSLIQQNSTAFETIRDTTLPRLEKEVSVTTSEHSDLQQKVNIALAEEKSLLAEVADLSAQITDTTSHTDISTCKPGSETFAMINSRIDQLKSTHAANEQELKTLSATKTQLQNQVRHVGERVSKRSKKQEEDFIQNQTKIRVNEGKHALQTQHKQEIERLRGVLTNENSEYQENFMAAKKRNEEAEKLLMNQLSHLTDQQTALQTKEKLLAYTLTQEINQREAQYKDTDLAIPPLTAVLSPKLVQAVQKCTSTTETNDKLASAVTATTATTSTAAAAAVSSAASISADNVAAVDKGGKNSQSVQSRCPLAEVSINRR